MKQILLALIIFIGVNSAKAQFSMMGGATGPKINGRITATVLDSATKKTIDYATVSLISIKTGKPVNGGLTDDKGKVVIQNVPTGDYNLSVGFIGYVTKLVKITTTPSKPDFNAGDIFIAATTATLKEVGVTGTKALIENKIDRMVYNAEADATNAGGDATDVMRKVPMLSVDINGNVQLRGGAVRVLINGKPSGTMANSVADALKMLPADQIKSVEVITSPSAKYDAEGSGGIINIITKKSNSQGVSGSVNATAGTRQNMGSFNLTAKTNRLTVNTNLASMYAYPQDSRVVFFNQTPTNEVLQDGTSRWSRQMYNGSFGLDYDFNAYNNISTNVKYNHFFNGGPGNSMVTDRDLSSGAQPSIGNILSNTDMGNGNLDWNVDYKLTSKKKGEELSVSGQLTTGRNSNDFTNDYRVNDIPFSYLSSSNTGKNKEYTAQADYVYPFSSTVTWEVGAKGIWRNIQSQYGLNSAQDFDYDQDVAGAYSTIAFNLTKKMQFKGGVRGEYTQIDFLGADNSHNKNDYFNLFPSAILSQNLGKGTVKLSYNRRVQRPSLAYINPFRNEANQFSVFQGNPNLNPELSDNFELGYNTFIKGSIINASVFYRRTQNIIENANQVDDLDPAKIKTTFANVGVSESYGFNVFGSYNPLPKWTLMSNFGLNTYQIRDLQTNLVGAGIKNTDVFVNYNLFMRSATTFNKGISLEFFGVLNSPRRTFQGKTDAMVFYGGAVKKEIFKKQGTIGLNVLNPFNRDLHIKTTTQSVNSYQTQNIYYPLRSFGINFSYKFGKLKFTEKKKIKNDDVKQDQNQQGGGMGGGFGQ